MLRAGFPFTTECQAPPERIAMTRESLLLLGWIKPEIWISVLVGMGLAYFTLGIGWMAATAFRRRSAPPEKQSDPAGPPAMRIPEKLGEKRGFTRRSGNAVPVVFTTSGNEDALENGWVIDRSSGGLCLSLEKPLDVGTFLRIRPSKAQVTAPWIEIQVKSCRADDANWELGCQFVTIPPFNTLLLFG
jgi:hypothetical protein